MNDDTNDLGPGKYGPECELIQAKTGAHGILLIVIGGDRGTGFSASICSPGLVGAFPNILRRVADDIEKSNRIAANQ